MKTYFNYFIDLIQAPTNSGRQSEEPQLWGAQWKLGNILTIFYITLLMLTNSYYTLGKNTNLFDPAILSKSMKVKLNEGNENSKNLKKNLISSEPYIIPVAWHVFYKSNLEGYLTEQKIQLTIDTLNTLFAPHDIMFVLAKLDPNGDCTEGITYNVSSVPYGSLNSIVDISNLKSVIHWDNAKYLNIYSVAGMVGSDYQPDEETEGYAIAIRNVKPGSAFDGFKISTAGNDSNFDPVDGVVVRASVHRFSLLSAHEIGHWLGLFHIWGPEDDSPSWAPWWVSCHDPNSPENVRNGDFVADTPRLKKRPYQGNCTTNTCPKFPDENGTDDGNDPRNNIMGYSYPCMTEFTQGQEDVMKNILDNYRPHIHTQQNLEFTGVLVPFIPITEITTSTTWTTSNLPNNGIVRAGNITVYSGAVLTINSGVVINMCKNSTIRVLPGGRINMYGTTITGQEPEWWIGIQVLGGSPKGVFTSYYNSKIENAKTGILSSEGGWIYCYQTEFNDNYKAVEIISANDMNVSASFNDCDFNNTYSGFYGFASLSNVNNVSFVRCDFNNLTNSTFGNNGIGVLSRSAKFEVGYQFDADSDCTFSGLDYGVRIETNRSSKIFNISNSQFSNCTYGIYLLQQNSGKIIYNQFSVGGAPEDHFDNYGVYFKGISSGVSIQENTFTGQYPMSSISSVGVHHENTGAVNKYLRRNAFINCDVANLATLINGNNTQQGVNNGLRYVCNSYQNGELDIFPESATPWTVNGVQKSIFWFFDYTTIPPQLKSIDRPTGNTFSGTVSSSLYNNMLMAPLPQRIDYYLRPNQQVEELVNPYGVSRVFLNENPVCNVEEFNELQQWPNEDGGFAGLSLPSNSVSTLDSAYQTLLGQQNAEYAVLNDLNNNWSQEQIDSLLSIISNYENILDHINHQLTYHYLSDTTVLARENYNHILERYQKYPTVLELLKELVAQSKWTDADTLIGIIQQNYTLYASDFTKVEEVFDLIKYKSILDSQDIMDIKNIADSYDGNGASWAQCILTGYGYLYHPNPDWNIPRQVFMPQFETTPQTYRLDDIQVYPNPFNDVITIDIPFYDLKVHYTYHITDIFGKIIRSGVLNQQKSGILVDKGHSGLLILHITSTTGFNNSYKLIKQ